MVVRADPRAGGRGGGARDPLAEARAGARLLGEVAGFPALPAGARPAGHRTGGEAAYAGVVLVAVAAQEGVRLGRRAYLVTAAPPAERPLYVALANTIIGVVMIALVGLGVIAQLAGVPAAVGAVLGLSLLGVAATRRTPEPEAMTGVR